MMRLLPLVVALTAALPASGQQLVTDDLDRFWRAWDRLPSATSYQDTLTAFFEEYYLPGTPGLHAFVRARIGSVIQLVDQIRSHPRYYASLRGPSGRVTEMLPEVRAMFARWDSLMPGTAVAPTYFLIGRMNSGGTTGRNALLIGVDMYGRTPTMPEDELGDWHREVLAPVEHLPRIVMHEMFHTIQDYTSDRRLLARVITEGVPDFLTELVAGAHINTHIHEWAEPRARALWSDFTAVMQQESNAGWLYGRRADGEPNDLGYWMGYRIAKAYYERAADPQQAIRDMLAIRDFDAFLAASGIAGDLGR